MKERASADGLCPSCEHPGPTGEACSERVCSRRGYHFIGAEHLAGRDHDRLDPLIGRDIDEYLIVDLLGAGGFGKVYLALQRPLMMRAALKLMHAHPGEPHIEELKLKKFAGEAQALARLTHPHIVRLLKYGVHGGAPYMVMEFVEGARTLKKLIADRALHGERMELADAQHILKQLVDGLDAAHRRHIVHRDVKPENIMLQEVAGNPLFVRILDFGLAKFVAERTETSMAMGTPVYMAPEQLTRRHIGPWTDLYAVGCIAYEMATGRRPFGGDTAQDIIATKLDRTYDPLSRVTDLALPARATRFFRRALAKDHAARHQNAAEFREDLASAFAALSDEGRVATTAIDLSGLLSAADLQRASLERERLAEERRRLETERQALAIERQRLEAQTLARTAPAEDDEDDEDDEEPPTVDMPLPDILRQTVTGHATDPPRPAPPRRSRAGWLAIGGVLAIVVGAISVYLATSSQIPERPEPPHMEIAASAEPVGVRAAELPEKRLTAEVPPTEPGGEGPTDIASEERYQVPLGDSPALGPDTALVTIVAFSDFQCPFCSRVLPTLEALRAQYGDDLRLVFKHNPLPFHPNAQPAAEAAVEAHAQRGDAGFWDYHDALFDHQRALGRDDLERWAEAQRLDMRRFRAALDDRRHAPTVKRDQDLARRVGATGTPTFFINGRKLVGAQKASGFQAVIERELARARDAETIGIARADIYSHVTSGGLREHVATPAPEVKRPQDDGVFLLRVPDDAPSRGARSAPVTLQVFSDFQCPFCSRINPTLARLEKEFRNELRIVWRNHPLTFHKQARAAAEAAREVYLQRGDEVFWRYHDLLFENARDLSRERLIALAGDVGADVYRVATALDQGTHQPYIEREIEQIQQLGIDGFGTPASFINGRLYRGARPFDEMRAAVKRALAEAL